MRLLLLAFALGACSPTSQTVEPPPTVEIPVLEDEPVVADGPFDDLEDYRTLRAAAVADLEGAIGTPSANGARSCLVLPVGVKACGGPSSFVAYSTETAEVPVLLGLAKRIADLDDAANAQFQLASDCSVLFAPPAVLEDGMCRLGD
ncbi:hypothetical protein [Rubrivirga sp.]|uniref:hypothetical protein n=1 Tax=Rubrivirga sp. TaxID=1885344 RepID=UPI003C75BD5F